MKVTSSIGLFLLLASSGDAFQARRRSRSSSSSPQLLWSANIMDGSSMSSSNSESSSTAALASTSKNNDKAVDWDWEQVAANVFTNEDKRPIVLFDGVCNLCNGGVNFAMDQDESAKLRFCSLHSKVAQSLLLREGKSLEGKSNIALVTEDGAYFSSDAVTRICQQLDSVPLQWIGQLGQYTPNWIREPIYKVVSNNRYKFGESDQCRLDFDGTYTSRFISDPIDLVDRNNDSSQ